MLYPMEMFGGMFVLGGIATAYMAAFEAEAEMNPTVAHLYAFFAHVDVCLLDFDGIQMRTGFWHLASN